MTSDVTPRRFAALRDPYSRGYLITAGLSMLGDNTEHVLTYWVLWEKFHSPALIGFEVISHWLPFLLLSVPFGALAERVDCRRLIQVAQIMFMMVSAAWGVLFATDSLQLWQACLLLVVHGCAGALWAPGEQLLLHDLATPAELPNAIRLNSTFRQMGTLLGPVVGSGLLLTLGPTVGIFLNVLLYLPMTILMLRIPATGHLRAGPLPVMPVRLRDQAAVMRTIAANRAILSMIVLAGLIALCVGNSVQTAMPAFADTLGAAGGGEAYGLLLVANGIGGVVGGFLIEATGRLRANARTAAFAAVMFGATSALVALTSSYAVALGALVVGGVAALTSQSVAQAVVQSAAPVEQRGRVIGFYNMVGSGFRVGNGLLLAVLGTWLGVGPAIAVGAGILLVGGLIILQLLATK